MPFNSLSSVLSDVVSCSFVEKHVTFLTIDHYALFLLVQIVHRDIAARNILLQEHRQLRGKLIAKISDWGLSRRIAVEGMYQAQTEVCGIALAIFRSL